MGGEAHSAKLHRFERNLGIEFLRQLWQLYAGESLGPPGVLALGNLKGAKTPCWGRSYFEGYPCFTF